MKKEKRKNIIFLAFFLSMNLTSCLVLNVPTSQSPLIIPGDKPISQSPLIIPSDKPASEVIIEEIKWDKEQKAYFDIPYPPTVLLIGDELKFGGIDLTDMSNTDQKIKADIRFEGEYLYSRGIIEVNELLTSNTKSNISGYLNYVKYSQGKIYLSIRADGSYTKIRIDRVTPSRVDFSYVLQIKEKN